MKETNQLRKLMESVDSLSQQVDEADDNWQDSTQRFKDELKAYHASKGTPTETHDPNWPDVNYKSVQVDGINRRDHPDYSDAYISYAEFNDGTQLTDEEMSQMTDDRSDIVNELANEEAWSE